MISDSHFSSRAFSLIEVLVGIAILSILGYSASSSIRATLKTKEVYRFTAQLSRELDLLTHLSSAHRSAYSVSFDAPREILLRRVLPNTEINPSVKIIHIPSGLEVSAADFGNLNPAFSQHTLLLRPNGSATPGRITIRSKLTPLSSCTITQALRGARTLACSDVAN